MSHSTAPLDLKKAKKVIWHNKQFGQPDWKWLRDASTRDANVSASYESALELFQKFFANELYGWLAEETNIRFMMKTGKTYNVTEEEIKKFLEICIIMVNLKFPRLLLQWQTKCCVPIIYETMTQSRFLLIHTNFAVTSFGEPLDNTNKYWNVRPVVEVVTNGCRALEKEELKN